MKFKLLPFTGKTVWQNNKPFIWFLLSLLLIHSVLKIIFYQYNHQLLFTGVETGITANAKTGLLKWSLIQDLLTLLGINSLLLFALTAGRTVSPKISTWLIIPLFVLINSFALLLNLVDIFYFRFHFQRASADLLYVVDHPFNLLMHQSFFIILFLIVAVTAIIYLVWILHKRFYTAFTKGNYCGFMVALLLTGLALGLIFKNNLAKFLVPTYPMVQLKSNRLPIVQNSFHTFLYSVFRKGESIRPQHYMTDAECDSLMPIRKKLQLNMADSSKKNIVLFIMESVPYDFFDTASPYKVAMPFFDTILKKSTFFNNAFAYSHESNKGITAILAGIPTISDIPVYHSQYINIPITPIGAALNRLNYHSLFCIGDEYDNFGFAKCMNWLGIDKYYSKEDVPGYKKLPAHSMGLQDEYVLDFFKQKIDQLQVPFFAVHYNISTHYPYDIPLSFSASLPKNYTAPMKSMRYYDHSLQKFFDAAAKQPWFANTLFIFCSDHWLVPDDRHVQFNAVTGYRIPILIYEAGANEKKINTRPVSQFDIMGTVLAAAGYKESIISYGNNLLDSSSIKGRVFSKPNSTLYQVTDSSFVLGFNIISNKVEYLYNYKKDILLKQNLANDTNALVILHALTREIKAFLQKAGKHY
ncbi:MAG: sulfatase-like hydrolase/transferase, partial [Ferruginibacter sp.]